MTYQITFANSKTKTLTNIGRITWGFDHMFYAQSPGKPGKDGEPTYVTEYMCPLANIREVERIKE